VPVFVHQVKYDPRGRCVVFCVLTRVLVPRPDTKRIIADLPLSE